MSKTSIFYNNNDEKLLTNCKKKLSRKKLGDLPFFISNKFIDFSESI